MNTNELARACMLGGFVPLGTDTDVPNFDPSAMHQAWINAGASETLVGFLDFVTLGERDPLKEGLQVIADLDAARSPFPEV